MLGLLALGNVSPGKDDALDVTAVVKNKTAQRLQPDVMPVSVAVAIFKAANRFDSLFVRFNIVRMDILENRMPNQGSGIVAQDIPAGRTRVFDNALLVGLANKIEHVIGDPAQLLLALLQGDFRLLMDQR